MKLFSLSFLAVIFSIQLNAQCPVDLGPDTAACDGQVIVLDAGPGYTYLWSDNSVNQTLTVSSSGSYWVMIEDTSSCSNSDTINVVFNPIPIVEIMGDTMACDGESVTLDAGMWSTYLWSDNSIGQTLSVDISGMYWVNITDPSGCTNSDTINVVFSPLPMVEISGATVACDGDSIVLDAGSWSSYIWSDSSMAQTLSAFTSGMYWVIVADTLGCTNSDTITLMFNPTPIVEITGDSMLYWGYEPLECGTLTSNVSAGLPPYSITWSNGETTQSIVVCDTMTTSYVVTVTDQNGCTAVDTFLVTVQDVRCGNNLNKVVVCHVPPGNPANEHNICISENAVQAHLNHGCYVGLCNSVLSIEEEETILLGVHPNPSNGVFHLSIEERGPIELMVVSLDGRVLAEKEIQGPLENASSDQLFPELELFGSSALIISATTKDGRQARQTILILR